MKTVLFVAALAISGAALAQTDTTTADPAAGSTVSAPGNTAPETDARGIPVISDPAQIAAGLQSAGPAGRDRRQPEPAAGAAAGDRGLSACSRTVTDNCVQAYERGARPR